MSTQSQLGDHPSTIPDFVEAQISQLVSSKGFTREYVLGEYLKAYIQSSQKVKLAFPNATPEVVVGQRQRIAISTVTTTLQNSQPINEYDVIYLGQTGLRYAKNSKKPYCNMFVASNDGGMLNTYRLSAFDKYAEIYKNLQPLQIYNGILARYKMPDGKFGDFLFDYRCEFKTSRPSGLDVNKLCEVLRIPTRTLGELLINPPKLNDAGWANEKEMYCVFGNLSGPARVNVSKTEVNAKGEPALKGRCKFTDLTITDSPYTDNSGYMVYPGFDCYCAAENMALDDNAYCAWIGSVKVAQNKQSGKIEGSMNAVMIIPIFSMTESIQES